jgi:glutamate dehydrogenase/leucine dehydrogenase
MEVMRFCQSFMMELQRHIGADMDVPAGDIGVGGREIGYLYGQYKRIQSRFEGVLTGKNPKWGGSLIRPEATGYGAVYFLEEMLKNRETSIQNSTITVSGAGNVAQYCVEKLIQLGGKVITMSDSSGYIYEPNGFTMEQLSKIQEIKNVQRGRIHEYSKFSKTATFYPKKKVWEQSCDIAIPCATQNEIDLGDMKVLLSNGLKALVEGANMPTTSDAIELMEKQGNVLFGPAKAANAGGVSVSCLEMAQNSARLSWTREKVDGELKKIMKDIYLTCLAGAKRVGHDGNLRIGANVGGFLRLADSMDEQGIF